MIKVICIMYKGGVYWIYDSIMFNNKLTFTLNQEQAVKEIKLHDLQITEKEFVEKHDILILSYT